MKIKFTVSRSAGAIAALIFAALFFAAIFGWGLNIVKLVNEIDVPTPNVPLTVLRGIGIPVVPLGCVMGYIK